MTLLVAVSLTALLTAYVTHRVTQARADRLVVAAYQVGEVDGRTNAARSAGLAENEAAGWVG